MTFHEDIIKDLQNTSIFGNSLYDYAQSIAVFIATLVVLELIRRIVIRRLLKREKLIKSRFASISLKTLSNYLSFSLSFVVSLYTGSLNLNFNPAIDAALKIVVFGVIGWLILKLGLDLLNAILEHQRSIEDTNIHILEFFRVIARAVLIVIVAMWFLTNLGVDVTAFVASLGVLSLAFAFALREVISDIFASIVIFIDRPFEIGDAIKIDNDAGAVEHIGIRSTKIRPGEGHIIVASNRELTSKKIHNLKRMDERRVTMTINIHQSSPVSTLNKVPPIVKELISRNENFRFDKFNLRNIGDYAYEYELTYFVKSPNFTVHAEGKHHFLIDLIERLDEGDIMIPYPTQTVVLEE